ncbi:MAG TPA: NAD(P)-dependent oxidoreductase, partial [Amaricoccus sp.]|nr:NAD(P)-dependent oxidoreductase [Amaricoccus sp.]
MRHYPVYVDLRDRTVVVSGAGDVAVAKLRLLMKTEARIEVYGSGPVPQILGWAREGRIMLVERAIEPADAVGAALLYGANGGPEEDARAAAIGRAAGALVNIVDDLDGSDFITPAIV